MLPSAGGFSGFRIAAGLFKLSDGAEVANVSLTRAGENAATKPNAADLCSNSLRFIAPSMCSVIKLFLLGSLLGSLRPDGRNRDRVILAAKS